MIKEIEGYDWQEAFGYAGEPNTNALGDINISSIIFGEKCDESPFIREDVKKIHGQSEGEPDGSSWMIFGQLKDGRWFYLEAGCDYTGWDCQANGSATVARKKSDLIKYGLTDEARERFGIKPITKTEVQP